MPRIHSYRRYTIEEFEQLPDDVTAGYELVNGAMVARDDAYPIHGYVEARISYLLTSYVTPRRMGRVFTGETGFITKPAGPNFRGSDVAYISYDRMPEGPIPPGLGRVAPDLIVEVLSPSERARAVRVKTEEWLASGVTAVWNADPETRTVQVHTSAGTTRLAATDVIDGGAAVPGFTCRVAEFFD